MDKFKIQGGNKITGDVIISGSKNTSLTLLSALILTDGESSLVNLPLIDDVVFMQRILMDLGADISISQYEKSPRFMKTNVKFKGIPSKKIDYNFVKKMRASILLLGPMLSRFGSCEISLPGGCNIGLRPIDFHLEALKKLGANIELENGYVKATCKRLIGNKINFPQPSVGATANTILAATLAKGETLIENASIDPDILALVELLILMGAKIQINNRDIIIEGVNELKAAEYQIKSDRIEMISYICLTAATDGNLNLMNCNKEQLIEFKDVLHDSGILINEIEDGLNIKRLEKNILPVKFKTGLYPMFSTDCQAPIMAMLSLGKGISEIEEGVFENRFMHVPELIRMGADIKIIDGKKAIIKGIENFKSANVMTSDLRGGFALVIAALCAKGESIVDRVYHIDRGYESLVRKINNCGGDIKRFKE